MTYEPTIHIDIDNLFTKHSTHMATVCLIPKTA